MTRLLSKSILLNQLIRSPRENLKTYLINSLLILLPGNQKNSIGNYTSLDLKDAEVSFAGTAILNKGGALQDAQSHLAISGNEFHVVHIVVNQTTSEMFKATKKR